MADVPGEGEKGTGGRSAGDGPKVRPVGDGRWEVVEGAGSLFVPKAGPGVPTVRELLAEARAEGIEPGSDQDADDGNGAAE
jgi:hypothetical protein